MDDNTPVGLTEDRKIQVFRCQQLNRTINGGIGVLFDQLMQFSNLPLQNSFQIMYHYSFSYLAFICLFKYLHFLWQFVFLKFCKIICKFLSFCDFQIIHSLPKCQFICSTKKGLVLKRDLTVMKMV